MYSIRRHAANNNYESGCILQSSMTHHVVSMMTEFRPRVCTLVLFIKCSIPAWDLDIEVCGCVCELCSSSLGMMSVYTQCKCFLQICINFAEMCIKLSVSSCSDPQGRSLMSSLPT